jgi:hypothetical protein
MDEGTIPNAVITIKFMLPFYQAVDVSTLASHAESIRTVSPVSGLFLLFIIVSFLDFVSRVLRLTDSHYSFSIFNL